MTQVWPVASTQVEVSSNSASGLAGAKLGLGSLGPFCVQRLSDSPMVDEEGWGWCFPAEAKLIQALPPELRAEVRGRLSPVSPTTLPLLARDNAGCPSSARHFAFAYPVDFLGAPADSRSYDAVKQVRDLLADPETSVEAAWALFGGFLYYGVDGNVIGGTAFTGFGEPQPGQSAVHFDGPYEFKDDGQQAYAAQSAERWQRVSVQSLRDKGARYFCWLPPGEAFPEAPDGLFDGGFVYIFRDLKARPSPKDCFFKVDPRLTDGTDACAPMTSPTHTANGAFELVSGSPRHKDKQSTVFREASGLTREPTDDILAPQASDHMRRKTLWGRVKRFLETKLFHHDVQDFNTRQGHEVWGTVAVQREFAEMGTREWWVPFIHHDSIPVELPDGRMSYEDQLPSDAVESLKDELEMDPQRLYDRGRTGETALHYALLQMGHHTPLEKRARAVAEFLIENHADAIVNSRYKFPSSAPTWGPFDGQTALHIAIVKGDEDMVQLLLTNGSKVDTRAYGSYFRPGTPCYYGELPLSFAASRGELGIAQKLLSHWKGTVWPRSGKTEHLLTMKDSWGNTALHMAMLHSQAHMYDWLVDQAKKHGISRFEESRNCLGLTPVTLCALQGNTRMFSHLLLGMRRIKYHYGPVICFSIPLAQIDTVPLPENAGPDGFRSVLELVLMQNVLPLAKQELLDELLKNKWDQFGRRASKIALVFHLMFLAEVTMLVLAFHDDRPEMLRADEGSSPSSFVSFLEYIVAAHAVLKLLTIAVDLYAGKLSLEGKLAIVEHSCIGITRPDPDMPDSVWQTVRGLDRWLTGEKTKRFWVPVGPYDCAAWVGHVCILLHFALWGRYWQSPSANVLDGAAVCLSLAALLAWISSLRCFVLIQRLGTFVIIIQRVIRKDISAFFALGAVIIMGFAQAVYVLNFDSDDFGTFGHVLLKLFRVANGEKPDGWGGRGLDASATIALLGNLLYVLFTILTAIVLLRLLISMFNSTYAEVMDEAVANWWVQWGQSIILMERRLRLALKLNDHIFRIDNPHDATEHSYVFSHSIGSDYGDVEAARFGRVGSKEIGTTWGKRFHPTVQSNAEMISHLQGTQEAMRAEIRELQEMHQQNLLRILENTERHDRRDARSPPGTKRLSLKSMMLSALPPPSPPGRAISDALLTEDITTPRMFRTASASSHHMMIEKLDKDKAGPDEEHKPMSRTTPVRAYVRLVNAIGGGYQLRGRSMSQHSNKSAGSDNVQAIPGSEDLGPAASPSPPPTISVDAGACS